MEFDTGAGYVNPVTPPRLVYIVVISIAVLAAIGVVSLCASLFLHTYADPSILTAIISMTSGLVGSLTTILVSSKAQPKGEEDPPLAPPKDP